MRNTCNYMWLRNTTLCPAPLIAIGIANAIVTLRQLCCLRLHLRLHLRLRLWLPVSLVESMPGDNPRNLINTQVHGSKLSRQSIMYVTPLPAPSPAQSTFLPSGIGLSFDFASPASHVSVCGSHINTSFICLPGPETKTATATATVFVTVTESRGLRAFCTHCSQYTVRNTEFFPVVVSLSVFHTRFNWLLYLWSQFASILAFN